MIYDYLTTVVFYFNRIIRYCILILLNDKIIKNILGEIYDQSINGMPW